MLQIPGRFNMQIEPRSAARTTDAALSLIIGRELVINRFARWPTFADAEVLGMRLERGNHMQVIESDNWAARIAESLTVDFHLFDWSRNEFDPLRQSTVVTMRFSEGLESLQLTGFNYQNPIRDLIISRVFSDTRRCDVFAVDWGRTALQHDCLFTCSEIEVIAVKRLSGPDTADL
jgi:hypothetical protein